MPFSTAVRTALLAIAFLAADPASAHHSFAMFDAAKTVRLDGVVKDFEWTNPHIWLQLIVKDAAGKDQEWGIELAAVAIQRRQGWTRDALKPGDHVSVQIHPLRAGGNGGSLVSATLDGKLIGVPVVGN